jgi:hypothetical protein
MRGYPIKSHDSNKGSSKVESGALNFSSLMMNLTNSPFSKYFEKLKLNICRLFKNKVKTSKHRILHAEVYVFFLHSNFIKNTVIMLILTCLYLPSCNMWIVNLCLHAEDCLTSLMDYSVKVIVEEEGWKLKGMHIQAEVI